MNTKDIEDKMVKRLEYNSHDYGEMGKFLRLEYAISIVKDFLKNELEALIKDIEKEKEEELDFKTLVEDLTRVEVIDENGRSYVNWNKENKVELSFQDGRRTLKIFISKSNLVKDNNFKIGME